MSDKPPKEWVAGFLFLNNSVALIRKARPEWQRGKLNGVGGKVEKGETPHKAMDREWSEETEAPSQIWFKFSTLDWSGGRVHFFAARTEKAPWSFRRDTDERVEWYAVEETTFAQAIPNLRWLIPMALDKDNVIAQVHEPGTAWNHLAAYQAGTGAVDAWMLIETALPSDNEPVLLTVENAAGHRWVIRAFYAHRFTESTGDEDADGACEYNEEKDEYFLKPGWYEQNQYEETHWRVGDKAIAWTAMPLPACHGTGTAGEGEK